MRVLQILPRLEFGGVETGTVDFARYLVEKGHYSLVISSGGSLVKELAAIGSEHITLPVHRKSFTTLFLIGKIASITRQKNIDVVHVRSRVPAWLGFFATRIINKTNPHKVFFITTCHGHYSVKFASRVMGWGDRVIVASKAIGRHMKENFQVPQEKIRLIPRGVNLSEFEFIDPAKKNKTLFKIAIVGRITPLKGHSYFLKAISMVVRQVPNLKVLIVGDAPHNKPHYRLENELLVKGLGLESYVEFLGKRDDVAQILKDVNLLALSTVEEEAFGRVILEAQASGVVTVVTRVGGVVDIIEDEKTGILVPPKDSQAMAQAIVRLIKDQPFSSLLSKNAYKKLRENYTLSHMADKVLDVYKEAMGEKKILIIKFSALGDIILSTPALNAIRHQFEKAHIALLTSDVGNELLKRCPFLDEVIIYDYKNLHKKRSDFNKLIRELRANGYDLIIDLQNNKRSHIISFLSFASKTAGYNNGKFSFLLNQKVKMPNEKMLPVEHQAFLLEQIGIKNSANYKLELWPEKKDEETVDSFLNHNWTSKEQSLVGINIGGSWPTKRINISQVVKLCDKLSQDNLRVVLTGSAEDQQRAERIIKQTSTHPINACGKTTLNQLVCLIKKCKVFITSDSAPLHIAAAVNVATIAIFGPTDSQRHLPPNKNLVLFSKNIKCGPCYKAECKDIFCINSIDTQDILDAVKNLLNTEK